MFLIAAGAAFTLAWFFGCQEAASVADTRHAVGVTSPDGIELLIHMGVDTVSMNGDSLSALWRRASGSRRGRNSIPLTGRRSKRPDIRTA